jgi:hypothetical protein
MCVLSFTHPFVPSFSSTSKALKPKTNCMSLRSLTHIGSSAPNVKHYGIFHPWQKCRPPDAIDGATLESRYGQLVEKSETRNSYLMAQGCSFALTFVLFLFSAKSLFICSILRRKRTFLSTWVRWQARKKFGCSGWGKELSATVHANLAYQGKHTWNDTPCLIQVLVTTMCICKRVQRQHIAKCNRLQKQHI